MRVATYRGKIHAVWREIRPWHSVARGEFGKITGDEIMTMRFHGIKLDLSNTTKGRIDDDVDVLRRQRSDNQTISNAP